MRFTELTGFLGSFLLVALLQGMVRADCNGNGIPDDQELIVDGSMWASSVLGYSSQFSDTAWSAFQALGEPDTMTYGDIDTAWATSCADDGGGLG